MRYYVILTKGNREKVIRAFESQSEAVRFGKSYFSKLQPGDGVITIEDIREGDPQHRIVSGWHF